MSLRTDYTGALDTKLGAARQAGYDFVTVDNLADIQTQMSDAADQGKKKFTLTFPVSFQPADLRLEGPLWGAYRSGIQEGLISEDIMLSEAAVKLNTDDSVSTKVDMEFDFTG